MPSSRDSSRAKSVFESALASSGPISAMGGISGRSASAPVVISVSLWSLLVVLLRVPSGTVATGESDSVSP